MIEQLIAGARIGQGGALVITGDPGVGKTTLLAEALEYAEGMRVLRAAGSEPEREIPFGALHQVLRPALDRISEIPAPQAEALSAALALSSGAAGDRFAVGAATLSLLCRFAEEQPVAILLDDLQWVDRPSVQALSFAARRLLADPIVLLAASRTADPADGLPLLPLSGIDLAAADELVARLHRATAGNPLALIELAGAPARWTQASPEAPPPVSDTLARAFAARAQQLGDAARAALTVAAIAGEDLRVISRTCTVAGIAFDALGEAEDAGLIRIAGGRVEFRHPLVRSAVYGDAPAEQRRSIHRAVAAALGPREPDRHAWHLAEASLGPDARVAELLTRAATRAHGRSAHDVAAAAFEQAARLSPDVARHGVLCVAAAESAWLAGNGPRATALLAEAGDLSVAGVRLRALELRGAIAARTGSLLAARDVLLRAAREAPDADTRLVMLADAISACFYLGQTARALELAVEIEGLLDAATTPRAKGLGQIAAGVARILANVGGAEHIRSAVELFASSEGLWDDQHRMSWLLVGPLFLRDAESGAGLRDIVRDTRARAAVGTLPSMLFYAAREEATTNQWMRAEATYDEGIRLARETGQNTELVMCLAGLAWLRARLGREHECRALVAEALPICLARDIYIGRIWCLFTLGELELGLGNTRDALAHLGELDALVGQLGMSDPDVSPAPELTDALLRVGKRAEAAGIAARFREAALAKGQPWALARAERAAGMAADDAAFDPSFEAALGFHASTLDEFETARTRLAYGARLRRARRRTESRPQLRAALDTFEALGAVPWADLAAVELAATGESIQRSAPTGLQTLTPQERQISLLLAEGRTTREVAAALFLSPKTVEYHLRKVYTKLGIRSRTELSALLA